MERVRLLPESGRRQRRFRLTIEKIKTSMTARGMLPRTWLGWHFVRSLVVTGGQRGSLQAGNLDFPLDKGGKGGYVRYPTDLSALARENRRIIDCQTACLRSNGNPPQPSLVREGEI